MNLQEMYDGWKNLLIPEEELKPFIEEIAAKRTKICEGCPFHSKNVEVPTLSTRIRFDDHCTKCGCTLSAKTRSLASSCPLEVPLWGPEVNDKQQE
jgi:hypothetical protein